MLPSKDEEPKLTEDVALRCFGCGDANPIGLKLSFENRNGSVTTNFIASEHHQGWPGYVHGGILFTILDEAMGHTFYHEGLKGVTARAEVRFKKPAPIGELLLVEAVIIDKTKRLIKAKATITLSDGTLIAESKGLMYIVAQ